MHFVREAIQTRNYGVAKNATLRADRPDSSRRKERLLGMTNQTYHYPRMPLLATAK